MSIHVKCLEYCLKQLRHSRVENTQQGHDGRAVCWESKDSVESQGRSGWLSRCILPGTRSSTFPELFFSQVVYNVSSQLDSLVVVS